MKKNNVKQLGSLIECYFLISITILIFSILALWSIKKPQVINGFLATIKKQTDCYYMFQSVKPLLIKKKIYLLLVNNEVTDFLNSSYEIKDNKIIFNIITSCSDSNYQQPALLIYNEITLLSYLVDLFWY